MSIDCDAEDWLGNPTREEMLEHHARLVEAENELLRQEVERYRTNQAKLIDMVSSLTTERDHAAKELAATKKSLSLANNESYELDREVGSLKRILSQRDAVMRMHNIPEHYFGTPRTES